MDAKQTYKSRAEAFREFIAPQAAISQAKFYADCARLKMVQADKSLQLADLVAYLAAEAPGAAPTGQSPAEVSLERRKAEADLRHRQLQNEKLEAEKRKEDRNWLHRDTVHEREGALVARIMGELRYQNGKAAPAVIAVCKGDPARSIEVSKLLEEAVFSAFRSIYDGGEIDVTFEEDDEA